MSELLAAKRLTKDYSKLMKDPVEHCWVAPNDNDILTWHVMFELQDAPFKGCQVLCILTFPKNYPMKAPDIKVLTPTGRFETDRTICMTNTGYHNECWSPLWSLSSLIVGFISSFYEPQVGLGHLSEPAQVCQKHAVNSKHFNATHYPDIVSNLISRGNGNGL